MNLKASLEWCELDKIPFLKEHLGVAYRKRLSRLSRELYAVTTY